MGLEAANFIVELVATNPTGADDYATADDHLRLIKAVLQAQFPNFGAAAVVPTEVELNFVDGVTSAIQAQIDGKAPTAHSHTSGEISALDVSDITTGIFAASFIPNLDTGKITTGIFVDARIPNLDAGKITTGAFATARIPNLNASKISAGTFAAARIPTHTGDVTGQTALIIAANAVVTAKVIDNAITYAKIQNVSATNRFLGRDTAGAGDIEEITAAAARTILGIEAGATADQTNAEIKTAYEANADTNAFDNAEQSKLAAISGTNTGDEPAASTTVPGIVERATAAEADALADTTRYVSPADLPIALTTQQGLVERATQAEVDAGSDTTRYVSPATLAAAPPGPTILTAVKTADESVVNNTLQDDNHLTVTLINGKYYQIKMTLQIDTNDSATPDFKFQFTVPAGSTGHWSMWMIEELTTGIGDSEADITFANARNVLSTVGAKDMIVVLEGVVLAGAAGAFTLRWAQNTTDAGNATTVKKTSSLVLTQLN